jgi:bacterioferritin (cytochrome b1)
MTNEQLIALLQEDLKNERMHCLFYQQAASLVQGLHREELRELFLKEAQSELVHVDEFANLITLLGGVPNMDCNQLSTMSGCPSELCEMASLLEQHVADNYAARLRATHEMENASTAYCHVFYEEQITDSQRAAWEFKRLASEYKR